MRVALIVLFGLALRLAWGLHLPAGDDSLANLPDQREYYQLGVSLRDTGTLRLVDPRFNDVVRAYRTPGYPALIALLGGKLRLIRLSQAALDASCILAAYLLARRYLPESVALLAAGLVAVNPFLIYFNGLILSETLFTSMMVWGMVMLMYSEGPWPASRQGLALWLGGAVLLALTPLVRPGAMALPVVLGSVAAVVHCRLPIADCRFLNEMQDAKSPSFFQSAIGNRQSAITKLPVAGTFLLLTGLAMFPWAWRNQRVLQAWVWTSTNEGITRYDGFSPEATGASDQRFVQRMPWLATMNEVERSRFLSAQAGLWMSQHPRRVWQLALIKIGRTLSPMPLSDEYSGKRLYVLAGLFYSLPVDLLILLGLWRGKLPAAVKWYLLLPAIYFVAGAALTVGSLRYLLPAAVPLAVLAASAAQWRPRHAAASSAA